MHYSIGISGGGRGDGDALGTDVPSGGGNNDEDDWNRGVTRQQQLHMQDNGGVMETSGAPGRGSGGDREDESGPLSGTFSGGDDGAVYGGFFTLQHICSINLNPSSQMLSAISSFSRTAARGLQLFLGTLVLSSMASLPRTASTTVVSRVRGSGISCWVTASV